MCRKPTAQIDLRVYNNQRMKGAGDLIDPARFKKRPRYTMVLHDVRRKLGISNNTYVVIDSIHKLSTSNPDFPYCVMSKDDLGEFLELSRATVFRSIKEAEDAGLIERHDVGLRATTKWIHTVELYDIKAR